MWFYGEGPEVKTNPSILEMKMKVLSMAMPRPLTLGENVKIGHPV